MSKVKKVLKAEKRLLNQVSKKDELAAGHSRHEHYCPTCQVFYKSNDKSHVGH